MFSLQLPCLFQSKTFTHFHTLDSVNVKILSLSHFKNPVTVVRKQRTHLKNKKKIRDFFFKNAEHTFCSKAAFVVFSLRSLSFCKSTRIVFNVERLYWLKRFESFMSFFLVWSDGLFMVYVGYFCCRPFMVVLDKFWSGFLIYKIRSFSNYLYGQLLVPIVHGFFF